MTTRTMLLQHRTWLLETVIPGFQKRKDNESVRRCMLQIMDIEWLLETDPPRTPLNIQERKPYRDRPNKPPASRDDAPESGKGYKDSHEDETEGYRDD